MATKIRVTAIQRLCVNDGPGVRTVVFLKGCYLQCPWCCNPEAIHYDKDEYFDKGKCKYPEKNLICKNCELHEGQSSQDLCPFGAFEKTYKDYTDDEIYALLMRDENLYKDGGGVTFSGGEPLLQAKALLPLLIRLNNNGIHITFETTLYAPTEHYLLVKDYVDYWLVDLKFQFGFIVNHDYTIGTQFFENNLRDLQSLGKCVVYRMVVMEEMLNHSQSIIKCLREHNIDVIELLNYHGLAQSKYKELGIVFTNFNALNASRKALFVETLKMAGVKSVMLQL